MRTVNLSPGAVSILQWGVYYDGSGTSNYLFRGSTVSGSGIFTLDAGAVQYSQVPVSAGNTRRIRVKLNLASNANHTYTVRKNGVDTALTVTITAGQTTGVATTSVAFADGDLISVYKAGSAQDTVNVYNATVAVEYVLSL